MGQQTTSSVQQIQTVNICFLHAKHFVSKPPHASGLHKDISLQHYDCDAGGDSWRSKCRDLVQLYAGQSKQCAAHPPHNATNCIPGTACLVYLGEYRLPSGLCARTMASSSKTTNWPSMDTHLTSDRYSADLYSDCIVLYNIKIKAAYLS